MRDLKSNPKLQTRIATLLAAVILGFFVFFLGRWIGLKQGSSRTFTIKDGVLYTEESIGIPMDDFSTVSQIFHSISVNGVDVGGKIISVSVEDIVEIVDEIKQIENVEPIISITVISENQVEVTTGKRNGPLSGGGLIYGVTKSDGKWLVTGVVNSWVS